MYIELPSRIVAARLALIVALLGKASLSFAQSPVTTGIVLTSGVSTDFSLLRFTPDPANGLYNGIYSFRVQVPAGATSLSVHLVGGQLLIGRQQYRVYMRYNQDNVQSTLGGPVTSDYASPGDAEDTTLAITLSSTPPLSAGTYCISLFMDMVTFVGSRIAPFTGTITATVGPPCAFGVAPLMVTVPVAGGSGDLSVSTSTGCAWTAASDSSWLTVTPGAGSGSLTARYSASANVSTSARTGKIAIAGQTVTATQAGTCTYSLTPLSVAVPPAGGSGDLSVSVSNGCSWTANSDSSWLTVSSGTAGSGSGTIGYVAAANSSTVARSGMISVAGQSATFNQAGAPPPTISQSGVVNGASFQPGIAPGTWITIQGANLSATMRSWNSADFSGNNLPTQLDGVSVTVNGALAYVYFISPTQLNVLSPEDATRGSVSVQVTNAQGKSNVASVVEAALSPALFTFTQQGGKYIAAVRADGAYIGPPNLISGLATVPATPGDTILLFGTGFGPTTPPSPIGQLVNPAPLVNQATVRIGGVAAITQFAGIVSPGLYQFNVVVPDVPDGDNAVSVEIGGSSSQANAFLAVHK